MALSYKVGNSFEVPPEGAYMAQVTDYDEDATKKKFQSEERVPCLLLTFELLGVQDSQGNAYRQWARLTPSFNEKSTLTKICRALGAFVPTTDEEAERWSPEDLLGLQCMVQIKHSQGTDGVYANIDSYMAIPKPAAPRQAGAREQRNVAAAAAQGAPKPQPAAAQRARASQATPPPDPDGVDPFAGDEEQTVA